MPIKVKCNQCGAAFGVPEKYAGKRIKCPKCKQSTIEIPAGEQSAAKPAVSQPAPEQKVPSQKASSQKGAPGWYLQADETGETEPYGPVSKEEMDNWAAEGRLDATCQVLREGWEQWKWAEEVYPELGTSHAKETPAIETPAVETPAVETPAVEANPFAGIGDSQAPAPAVEPSMPSAAENAFVAPQIGGEAATAEISPSAHGGVTAGARRALHQTKPWVTFLAILGFISGGLGVIGGLIALAMLTMAGGFRGFVTGMLFTILPVVTLILSYYLFTYGSRIYVYMRTDQPLDLEKALVSQKSYWKLTGIVVAIMLAVYIALAVVSIILVRAAANTLQDGLPPGF